MDNIKIAIVCLVLFCMSLAFMFLVSSSITGFSECDECESSPLWISMNNSIIEIGKSKPLIATNAQVTIIDFHFKNNEIYWVEESRHDSTKIFRCNLKNSLTLRKPKYQLVSELASCGGLAVDWLHNHLYWADVGSVVVARLDGNNRRFILSSSDSEITTLAVDPLRGSLFWMEQLRGINKPHQYRVQIKSSNFRGEDVRIIVPAFVIPVRDLNNNIAVDVTERKLYFLGNEGALTMCDYDGKNKIEARVDLPSPVSFTVARKQLYWMNTMGEVFTSLKNGEQIFAEAFVCKDCNDAEKKTAFDRGFQLKVFDERMQPTPDQQEQTQDCLLNHSVSTDICPCSFGYRSIRHSNSCREEGFFLSSFGSTIQGVSSIGAKITLQFKRNATIVEFDYHFVKGLLFWFDSGQNIIYRAPIFNPSNNLPVALSAKGTAGLAVDWIYDHVYWTSNNANGGTVEVAKLDGTHRLQVVPRNYWSKLISIALDPAKGVMFISNWTDGTIEVMGMDGQDQMNFVQSGLKYPRSLTLDIHKVSQTSYETRQLFWLETTFLGQTSSMAIKSCYLQNRQNCKEVFYRKPGPRPSGITLLNNRIYWLDRQAIHNVPMDNRRHQMKKMDVQGKYLVSYSLKAYYSSTQPPGKDFCIWRSCNPGSLCLPSNAQYSQHTTRCVRKISMHELRSSTNYFNRNTQY